jgi:O-antigen/teichoic acid export membrane protein
MKQDLTIKSDHIEIFTSNATGTLSGKIAGKFLQVLIQIILARSLGAESYGVYSIGWVAFTLLGSIAPLGMDNGVIHFASEHRHADKPFVAYIVRNIQVLSAISGSMVGISMLVLAPRIAGAFEIPQLAIVLQIFGITLPLYSTLRVTSAAISLSQQIKYAILAEDIVQPLVNILLLVIVSLAGWGVLGATIAVIISFLVALAVALQFAIRLFPTTNSNFYTKRFNTINLLRFSVPTFVASLFIIFIISGNRLLLGYFKSPVDAGIFQAVSQASIVFTVILSGLNVIFAPLIADLYHTAELDRLNELFKISTKWGLYISIPLFLLIVFFPKDIIYVIFGQEYVAGTFSLIVLSISQLINAGTGAVGLLLVMTGKQKDWLFITFGTFIITSFISILVIPIWGLNGAAVTTAVGTSFVFIFSLFRVLATLKLWPYDLRYLKGLAATSMTAIVLFILTLLNLRSPLLKISIAGVACVLVFSLTLTLLKLDPEDLKVFGQYYEKLFRQNIE